MERIKILKNHILAFHKKFEIGLRSRIRKYWVNIENRQNVISQIIVDKGFDCKWQKKIVGN